MCYDISCEINIRELADYYPGLIFDNQIEINFQPSDHLQGVAIFPKVPVIYTNRQDMQLHCAEMEWGVIPHYATKEPTFMERNNWLNIRSERVLKDKKSYWYKIRNRRCLFPVPNVYEHREVKGWKKKVPYSIKPEEQDIFFIPGLYSIWEEKDEDGTPISKRWTAAFMTREASGDMGKIHNHGPNRNRMVLYLPFEMAKEFIGENLTNDENRYQEILDYDMASEDLVYFPVWTLRTNKPRPDGKLSKAEYFEWANLPPLGEANPD